MFTEALARDIQARSLLCSLTLHTLTYDRLTPDTMNSQQMHYKASELEMCVLDSNPSITSFLPKPSLAAARWRFSLKSYKDNHPRRHVFHEAVHDNSKCSADA
eukprot:5967469-Amphidinium_carterae.2